MQFEKIIYSSQFFSKFIPISIIQWKRLNEQISEPRDKFRLHNKR